MEMGGDHSLPPLQTAVDTEQIRNLQDCETYGIHVSVTKIVLYVQRHGIPTH